MKSCQARSKRVAATRAPEEEDAMTKLIVGVQRRQVARRSQEHINLLPLVTVVDLAPIDAPPMTG